MLKRLERDAARADLAAVEALLKARSEEDDPVGHLQFAKRAASLAKRVEELEATPSTVAEVGLFFGGRPVLGSYGIMADFGGKAVVEFQNLVSNTFAAAEGTLGTRGPVPQRDRTQLLLTDIARGSFGFILHQAEEPQLIDSPVKHAVNRAVDLAFRVASPEQEAFDEIVEKVDGRVLGSLRSFFKMLDDAGATIRFVDNEREFTLQRDEIVLARERTEHATLEEHERLVSGILYILPVDGRFELHPVGGGEVVRGNISPDCLNLLTNGGTEVRQGIIGTVQKVRLRVREIRSQGREPSQSFALVSLLDEASIQADRF